MAGILPRLFAAAVAVAGLASAGALVHAHQGTARDNGRFVEVLVAPVDVPMWGKPIPARSGHFVVSDEAKAGKRTSRTFPISGDELETVRGDRPGFIVENDDRRVVLDRFVAELGAQGLRPAGKGEAWYSHRFQRPMQ